jgi:class 3 adenylate cyclase
VVVRVRKTVSVLFAEVVGSTSLGERIDPDAMRSALERYFNAMRDRRAPTGGRWRSSSVTR